MTIPLLPASLDRDPARFVSRCIAHWRGEDAAVALIDGTAGVFSRGATATVVDDLGVSFTCGNQMPPWELRDWLNVGGPTVLGLRMGPSDRLRFPVGWRPRALAILVEFIEGGTVGNVNQAILSVSNDAASGARLVIDSSGTYYRLTHHNGSTSQVVTLAAAPTTNQRVVLRAQLYADGSVQLWQSINEGAETSTARSSANALAAAWASGAELRLNSNGTGNGGTAWMRRFKLVPNLPDRATLLRVA